MRFSSFPANAAGGAYGTALGAWSAGPGIQAEAVYGVFRNAYTKTATITAASFVRGAPCILTSASASNNGYDVVNADTLGQTVNELFVGCVFDYPDTTTGKTGVWQPEDAGIVQIYGIATNAVLNIGTVSVAAGLIVAPNTLSALQTIGQLVAPSGTGTGDTGTLRAGIAGLAVLYGTLASSSAAGTVAGKVFLRCM